jgi:hypothetical protein
VTTSQLTLAIIAVNTALSAGPAWAGGCMSSHPSAPYTILLEFGGHRDASYEIQGQAPVSVDVPPFQGVQNVRDEICERVAEDFSPFDVNVTTMAPPDFMPGLRTGVIAAIGGKGGEIGVRGNISSVLEQVALLTEFDQNNNPISAKEIASSVSHEMGHILASWTAVPMSHYTPALPATPDHNLIAQGKTQIMGGVRSQTLRDIWWKDGKTLLYLIPSAEGIPPGCYRQNPDDPDSPLWCCDEQFECVADPSGALWRLGLQDDVAILLAALGPRPDEPRGPVPYGANTPDEGLPLRAEGMTPAGDEVLGGAGIVELNAASFPRTCAPWETPSCVARRQWSNPPQERDFFKFRVAGNGTFQAYVVTIDEMDRSRPPPRAQQNQPEAQARCDDLAPGQTGGDQHRRDRLHRLHRDREPVEQARRDIEDAEAQQHADRGETCHRDRAQGVRQERAEVAKGTADLAGHPSAPRPPSTRAGGPIVTATGAHESIMGERSHAVQGHQWRRGCCINMLPFRKR